MASIDLNCDAGESFGAWRLGDDEALFGIVSSANVAAGFHAGDPSVIESTIVDALRHGLAIGAHPSYPDRQGFGRRTMRLSPPEVEAMVLYQISAVQGVALAHGAELHHVKPHGALYNDAARDAAQAEAIASAVRRSGVKRLTGLAGSMLIEAALTAGLTPVREAFCDRRYESDGSLRPRTAPDALILEPADAAAQALGIARDGTVRTCGGSMLSVRADSLCIHSDTPGSAAIAKEVRRVLEEAGVRVAPPP